MTTTIRHPAVAGRFYPRNAQRLREEVETFTTLRAAAEQKAEEPMIRALGCIVPHAGYAYSGAVAGALYRRLELPRRFVILCPNHTGQGQSLAIMSEGAWQTPLGDAVIDSEVAESLKSAMPLLSEDQEAHRYEHALEVQLPFLQVLKPGFQFVPITVGTSDFRGADRAGDGHRRGAVEARRASNGDRLQRHEPLRERRRYSNQGPPRDRPGTGAQSTRPL